MSGENRDILIAHLRGLMSVHASPTDLDSDSAIDSKNGCARDNGGCSHLCLMTPKGVYASFKIYLCQE